MTEEQLAALATFDGSEAFSPLEKLVLQYASAMTQTPVSVSEELFAALAEELEPPQIVELTSAIAWENYRARFDHAFGVESAGFSEGAYCPIAVSGSAEGTH